MSAATEATPTEQLIDRAFSKRLGIAALTADLAIDVAKITDLGKGKHSGFVPGNELTVVGASSGSAGSVSYVLPDDGEARARELSGDQFGKLFHRVVTYVPIEGFEHVAPAVLTPAKARDIVALCAVQSGGSSPKKAYILWPKAK